MQGNIKFIRAINPEGKSNGVGILDARLSRWAPSSHHQKLILVQLEGESRAYLGGIDICRGRWDTPGHNTPPSQIEGKYEA
jgi:hypothetical protein